MLGEELKKIRKKKGITQEKLAGKLGVSRQAICMWERERRDIKAKMLGRIVKVLGVSADEMIKPGKLGNVKREDNKVKKTKAGRMGGQKKVTFELMAPEAKKVVLAGDFNSWNTKGSAMRKDRNGLWRVDTSLSPGRYEYKFMVDGEWCTDPLNIETVTNTYGSLNSVKEVTV